MKFLCDIPIGQATIDHLRRQGHDVIRVRDRLDPTAVDEDIVGLAIADARVILCFDLDMAELVALSREPLPSVVTFRTRRHGPEYVNRRLDAVLPEIAGDLDRGVLATVEDGRVRLRPLPVQPQRP